MVLWKILLGPLVVGRIVPSEVGNDAGLVGAAAVCRIIFCTCAHAFIQAVRSLVLSKEVSSCSIRSDNCSLLQSHPLSKL